MIVAKLRYSLLLSNNARPREVARVESKGSRAERKRVGEK